MNDLEMLGSKLVKSICAVALLSCTGGEAENAEERRIAARGDSNSIAESAARLVARAETRNLPVHPDTIWLLIGEASIPIGVDQRFADIAAAVLPEPTSVPPKSRHDATALCYSFPGGFLNLYDAEWGMHTIHMSERPEDLTAICAPLSDMPVVVVASKGISIHTSRAELEELEARGFELGSTSQGAVYRRSWSYVDETRPVEWGQCFGASQSVIWRQVGEAIVWLQVQNFEEPESQIDLSLRGTSHNIRLAPARLLTEPLRRTPPKSNEEPLKRVRVRRTLRGSRLWWPGSPTWKR